MSVFSLWALLCSPTAVSLALGQPAAGNEAVKREALAQLTQPSGCGAECAGNCFAGNCLFASDSLDDADAVVDNTFRQSKPAWPEASRTSSLEDVGRDQMPGSPKMPPLPREARAPRVDRVITLELAEAEAEEARLQSENAQLRRQLAQWKETGAHVAEREAKVVEILSKPRAQSDQALSSASGSSSQADVAPVATVGSSLLQQMTRRSRSYVDDAKDAVNHSAILRWSFPVVIVALMICLWKFGSTSKPERNGELAWKNRMAQAVTGGSCGRRFQPLLRRMGWTEYKVEVSEIHLGSFFAGSYDVRVTFRMPNGTERRTKVLKNSGGAFLRFDDVVELTVPNSKSPCIICVGDRQGNAAQIDLAGAELVRLVNRPHQEYFRTELKPCRSIGHSASRRPYIAMRLRDITSVVDTAPAGLKMGPSFAV